MQTDAATDTLKIGKYEFRSRLFVGTGKYPSLEIMQEAHEVSGAEVRQSVQQAETDPAAMHHGCRRTHKLSCRSQLPAAGQSCAIRTDSGTRPAGKSPCRTSRADHSWSSSASM